MLSSLDVIHGVWWGSLFIVIIIELGWKGGGQSSAMLFSSLHFHLYFLSCIQVYNVLCPSFGVRRGIPVRSVSPAVVIFVGFFVTLVDRGSEYMNLLRNTGPSRLG